MVMKLALCLSRKACAASDSGMYLVKSSLSLENHCFAISAQEEIVRPAVPVVELVVARRLSIARKKCKQAPLYYK